MKGWLKHRSFPAIELCCLDHQRRYHVALLLTSLIAYTAAYHGDGPWTALRPPLFHPLISQHSAPRTPESSSGLRLTFTICSMAQHSLPLDEDAAGFPLWHRLLF